MDIWNDIFIVSIIHSESTGNDSQRNEAKAFIQLPCTCIRTDNSIVLEDPEAKLSGFYERMLRKRPSYMSVPHLSCHCIACIGYMTTPSDIIRMKDVQTNDCTFIICDSRKTLRRKEKYASSSDSPLS